MSACIVFVFAVYSCQLFFYLFTVFCCCNRSSDQSVSTTIWMDSAKHNCCQCCIFQKRERGWNFTNSWRDLHSNGWKGDSGDVREKLYEIILQLSPSWATIGGKEEERVRCSIAPISLVWKCASGLHSDRSYSNSCHVTSQEKVEEQVVKHTHNSSMSNVICSHISHE